MLTFTAGTKQYDFLRAKAEEKNPAAERSSARRIYFN
jgi:hypothetical protein